MKIATLLFNMTLAKPCGSSRYTKKIAEGLAEKGHEVWVIARSHPENQAKGCYLAEVENEPYSSWSDCLSDLSSFEETVHLFIKKLVDLHLENNFDIVNVQHCLFSTLCGSFLKMIDDKVPLIATCHGSETHESKGDKRMIGLGMIICCDRIF